METNEKNREQKLRRRLSKKGYTLHKSRIRNIHLNNHGGYMIVESYRNLVIHGDHYELTLKDVEYWAMKLPTGL
jgi:hypothetical protein